MTEPSATRQPKSDTTEKLRPCRFDTKSFWMQSACPVSSETNHSLDQKITKSSRMHVQTMRLLPEVASRTDNKLTFKEKWMNVTKSSKLPEVVFSVALETSDCVFVGEKISVKLHLERSRDDLALSSVNKKARPWVPVPDVIVESVEMKLKHTTHVRTLGSISTHKDHWSDKIWTDLQVHTNASLPRWVGDTSMNIASSTYSTQTLTNDQVGDIVTSSNHTPSISETFVLESESPLSDRLIPSFCTYNIS